VLPLISCLDWALAQSISSDMASGKGRYFSQRGAMTMWPGMAIVVVLGLAARDQSPPPGTGGSHEGGTHTGKARGTETLGRLEDPPGGFSRLSMGPFCRHPSAGPFSTPRARGPRMMAVVVMGGSQALGE
jgi:hypothetical protein